jgi:hypothetical protein
MLALIPAALEWLDSRKLYELGKDENHSRKERYIGSVTLPMFGGPLFPEDIEP